MPLLELTSDDLAWLQSIGVDAQPEPKAEPKAFICQGCLSAHRLCLPDCDTACRFFMAR